MLRLLSPLGDKRHIDTLQTVASQLKADPTTQHFHSHVENAITSSSASVLCPATSPPRFRHIRTLRQGVLALTSHISATFTVALSEKQPYEIQIDQTTKTDDTAHRELTYDHGKTQSNHRISKWQRRRNSTLGRPRYTVDHLNIWGGIAPVWWVHPGIVGSVVAFNLEIVMAYRLVTTDLPWNWG